MDHRRKNKSFHEHPNSGNNNGGRRGRRRNDRGNSLERRRVSLDEELALDRRRRQQHHQDREGDQEHPNGSLEPRYNQQQDYPNNIDLNSHDQQQLQQHQGRTVIHACDDKTGKCLFHPHIVLRKKAIFGMLGGWVDVRRSCPECESEDLQRLNSSGGLNTSGGFNTSGASVIGSSPDINGERNEVTNSGSRQRQPSKERIRRSLSKEKISAIERDKSRARDRTLSPLNRKLRDHTLSPVKQRSIDHLLSPRNKQRPKDRILSPEKRQERRKHHKTYIPPPATRNAPKERSRTLSPIDRSRKRIESFKNKKGYDEDELSYETDEEDTKRQYRNQRSRNKSHYNDSYERMPKPRRSRKKKVQPGRTRETNDNTTTVTPTTNQTETPHDYLLSYLATGEVPDPRPRRKQQHRLSLGGLNLSGNSTTRGEWKNISANVAADLSERGMKLAEKVMRKNKKKQPNNTNSTNALLETHSDDDKLDYLWKHDLIYDVDEDERSPYSSRDEISNYKSRRKKRVDSSDRTGDTDFSESMQTLRKKDEEVPVVPQSSQQNSDSRTEEDKYTYEKSWSSDGIRVHAGKSTADDYTPYDNYGKAFSDGSIRVAATAERKCEVDASQIREEQDTVPHFDKHTNVNELKSEAESTPPEPTRMNALKSEASTTSSQSISSDAFVMDKLKSVMHEYSAKERSIDDASDNFIPQIDSTATQKEEENNEKNFPAVEEFVDPEARADENEELNDNEQLDESSNDARQPSTFPHKPKPLPRVMSLGHLTIDLSALQATTCTAKSDKKPIEMSSTVVDPSTSKDDNSCHSDSEGSIKIDREQLQRARPKRDPDEETVKTFPTTNLPWTGRFGESGFYTGLVNEQYQPHGRGTMLFDHGEIKKGHWKKGDFVRESGPYSDSEDSDDEVDYDEEEDGDLSSSMMDLTNTKSYRSRSKSRDHGEPPPPPAPTPTYEIGETGKHGDMIQDDEKIEELVPMLDVGDGAFIRRSDGKWTFALVRLLENNDGIRAIRFTVNDKNSSKSYAEKYWSTHIRPMKVKVKQGAVKPEESGKKCDPAGIISRQESGKIEEPDKGAYCPPVQSRLMFGSRGRSRSRSRRRGASLTPMRTLCSIDESDVEDEDDEDNDDSFSGYRVELTGLHSLAGNTYALRGIDP